MTCDELREQTARWLDGDLSNEGARHLEAHAAGCLTCEGWLNRASAIPSVPREISPPQALRARTLAAAATRRGQRRLRRTILAGGGIAAAVLIALITRPAEKSATDFPGAGKALFAMKLAKPEFAQLDRAEDEISRALAAAPADAALAADLRRIRQQRAALQDIVKQAPE